MGVNKYSVLTEKTKIGVEIYKYTNWNVKFNLWNEKENILINDNIIFNEELKRTDLIFIFWEIIKYCTSVHQLDDSFLNINELNIKYLGVYPKYRIKFNDYLLTIQLEKDEYKKCCIFNCNKNNILCPIKDKEKINNNINLINNERKINDR